MCCGNQATKACSRSAGTPFPNAHPNPNPNPNFNPFGSSFEILGPLIRAPHNRISGVQGGGPNAPDSHQLTLELCAPAELEASGEDRARDEQLEHLEARHSAEQC